MIPISEAIITSSNRERVILLTISDLDVNSQESFTMRLERERKLSKQM